MIAIIPITLGIFFGITFMLWGSVCTSFVAFFLNSYYSADLIGYPTLRQIRDVLPTFFVSFVVASCMWGLSFLSLSYYAILPLQLVVGLVLAFLIYERMRLPEYLEIRGVVLSILHKIKNKF